MVAPGSLGPNSTTARIAGLLYLIVVVSGFFSILYVPSELIVRGDTATTVRNILASRTLFLCGIAAALLCYLAFLLLPLALHALLHHVSRAAAVLMVAFAVVSVPVSLIGVARKLDVLTLLEAAKPSAGFGVEHLHAQVELALASHHNLMLVSEVFWGLWLLPFDYLVFKSAMLPRLVGVLLMVGCFGYLIDVVGKTLVANFSETLAASLVTLPAGLGEIGSCLWLLLAGVRTRPRSGA